MGDEEGLGLPVEAVADLQELLEVWQAEGGVLKHLRASEGWGHSGVLAGVVTDGEGGVDAWPVVGDGCGFRVVGVEELPAADTPVIGAFGF